MVHNLPVKTLVHKDLTIEGYSRAAVQSYWRIPELKLGFDLGGSPWDFMGTPTIFINGQGFVGPKPPRVYAIALEGLFYWLK